MTFSLSARNYKTYEYMLVYLAKFYQSIQLSQSNKYLLWETSGECWYPRLIPVHLYTEYKKSLDKKWQNLYIINPL